MNIGGDGMDRKFSLAHLTVLGCTPPEMTYIAARTGYDFVSFRLINMGLPGETNTTMTKNSRMFKETKQALQETGVELLDIELARIDDQTNPKEYESIFEIAAELGGKHVISSIWTEDKNIYLEQFAEICDIANRYNLTVDLEYVPISCLKNLKSVLGVLYTVERENSGILIDFHHFHRAGDNVEDLQKVPKEWFHFLHLCDAPSEIPSSNEEMTKIIREERLYIGEGGIDITSLINSLPEVPCSIELPNAKRIKEYGYEEHARLCLQSAKNFFYKMTVSS
jgi:sugar phosphate isomerase/epimerase